MNEKIKRLLMCVHPPEGCQVRKLIGIVIIVTGFVRIFGTDPALMRRSASMIALYGVLQVIVGLGLLLTNHKYRYKLVGRIMAALAVGLLVILIVQFWPYPTGFAYIVFAVSLFMEATTLRQCGCKLFELYGIDK